MSDTECMQEVKDLVEFYEKRGSNWLSAAEFTLARHNGTIDYIASLKSRRPYSYELKRASSEARK